jgi:DNA-binding winged helix-turn-helix (wHTH) protein
MDSLITAAGRALAAGDPLGALKRVALRDDPPALALRGIAMAQLGDFARAKTLLKSAARGFGPGEAMARARCVVAEAEIALVSRDLSWPVEALAAARQTLARHGDRLNAAHAANLAARRLLLLGRLDEAEAVLADFDTTSLPPAVRCGSNLVAAGIALRRLRSAAAREALIRARKAAEEARVPGLVAEVDAAATALTEVAGRLLGDGRDQPLLLHEIEALFASGTLVVDASRNILRAGDVSVPLSGRPVLFALARALAEAWPGDVSRGELVQRAFGGKQADESHRARLRVEIGRLRAALGALAEITATPVGFALVPRHATKIAVLAPPVEDAQGALLALLADGEAWASSALAIALGTSARTVQRALEDLAARNRVQSFGRGRAQRWIAPPAPGFPTALLLPGPLPGD